MSSISRKVSQAVICEIAAVLGETKGAKAVGVTNARLKVLVGGRGQLSDLELKHIYRSTRKTWRTWLLSTLKRAGASHQILSPTIDLVNNLNDAESAGVKAPKSPKRTRTAGVV